MAQRTTLMIVSIDTEEDNWVPARDGLTVENIREMPRLHRFLDSFGARPTYFTSHAVVASPWGADVMRNISDTGTAEIGGHLHPWNTPPLSEPFVPRHTMMKNLSANLQREKLRSLTRAITRVVGSQPTAFRAGRWGLGADTVAELVACGYRVDSSVMPFVDWSAVDGGSNYDGAPCQAYRLGTNDVRSPDPNGQIVELPVSSGYSRLPFPFWHGLYERMTQPSLRKFRLGGIAERLRFVQKIQLSPETEPLRDMITLSRRIVSSGLGFLHVFFHSPSFTAGLNPYGATPQNVEALYARLAGYFEAVARFTNVRFATVTEAADTFLEPARAQTELTAENRTPVGL